jgi:cyclic-di-AMP phosphodiesterase PgpH
VSDLGHFVALMTICVSSIIPLRRIKSRLVMIKVGFLVAAVSFYAVWGVGVMQVQGIESSWTNIGIIVTALKFAGWSLVCCYLVAGSLPFIEQAFDVVTDISLLELTGVSHPLLMELARRAPGTYNHSMNVASLAEAAAESIGANGLLTRVGAYFHDIGKMTKPEYFIENMTEGSENQHKSLAPAMSTLIIIGHVKDGLELAEEHNLPEPLRAFIEQHHGTTLVEYFFHEANRKKDDDHRTDADESSFRYPGPKPQSRETAVLMVADAVESASRTLKEPTPKRIQSLVHEITMKRLLDGQFDECNLKMNEIRMIEESLIKSLLAAHHGRVRYPGQRTA